MLFCAIWEQSWGNVNQHHEKRRAWNESVKPDTFKVIGEYSLQGPNSRGITLFETDRQEDVNLYRNYFALAGQSVDIRVAIDLSKSMVVMQDLMTRW